jgi:seryl-tRNA synthetase
MPIDITLIRSNPELVKESQIKRFKDSQIVDTILSLDNQWRQLTGKIDNLRRDKNKNQKQIATFYKSKQPDLANDLLNENKVIDQNIVSEEQAQENIAKQIKSLINSIGNIIAPDVVISNNEDANNKIIKTYGDVNLYDPVLNPDKFKYNHHILLHKIGGFEPERGAKIAGHKGYFLTDYGLLLNQALINYGLNFLRQRSYKLLQPPYFMRKEVMAGVAQLEEFNETLYHVGGVTSSDSDPNLKQTETDDSYLIATSEQPICAYHQGEILEPKDLPKMYAGYSPCFRKEAGKHGKDTWGIFRVHQFDKVEQFVICENNIDTSDALQEQMLKISEEFYQSLNIPYRVISIVSGELNNAAIRKYDLEGWFPGYNAYRELVSCSNCTDYQSRAMDIRCGYKTDKSEEKKYVHMLNSTLCACTRVICCLLELGQTDNGVKLPEVLIPYMNGIDFLPFVRE